MRILALILALGICSPIVADEIVDLVKQLDAERFQDRESAAERLQNLGKDAIPALVQAANEGNLETIVRTIEILKKLAEGDEKETAAEATSALEKLAENENPGTSRRAKNALAPKPQPMPNPLPNRIQIGGFPGAAPMNAARRVSVKNVNGVKTIEAEEGNRKVTIQEDPNQGIQIEITETINGKPATEKFEAKSEDDLKKNHPKAHAEYEKHAKGNGIGFPMRRAPFGRAIPGVARANDARLDMVGRLLESIGKHVETLADDNTLKQASKESRKRFQDDITEMKIRLANLEKKLQSASDEENKNPGDKEKAPQEKAAE